ncbi:MAG TPA: tRNA (adenosine(37)-N6)-dimethylallyltransferase MiaA, partial [Chitinophagaceae bacterium]|nr:tRNA (adenosine(37)-N6)-dimethylallyltransferase MiaA [Chitinophagaceae bacterium]
MQKTCIVIVGPTASGKTSLSIQLASQLNTEIISADSRQCFKELNIGVAKPSPQELQQVKHYFINSHSIHDEVNAAIYEKLALQYANEIFAKHDVAIVVGGTGLYIKAFCEGLDDMPPSDPAIREKIIADFDKNGIEWLQKEIEQADPDFFSLGEIQNPQRMIRALEVKQLSGKSISSFKTNSKKTRPFSIIKI